MVVQKNMYGRAGNMYGRAGNMDMLVSAVHMDIGEKYFYITLSRWYPYIYITKISKIISGRFSKTCKYLVHACSKYKLSFIMSAQSPIDIWC